MHNAQRHKLARGPASLDDYSVPGVQIVEPAVSGERVQLYCATLVSNFRRWAIPWKIVLRLNLSALLSFQVLHISGGNACTVEE